MSMFDKPPRGVFTIPDQKYLRWLCVSWSKYLQQVLQYTSAYKMKLIITPPKHLDPSRTTSITTGLLHTREFTESIIRGIFDEFFALYKDYTGFEIYVMYHYYD
jgi:hypothetical protein